MYKTYAFFTYKDKLIFSITARLSFFNIQDMFSYIEERSKNLPWNCIDKYPGIGPDDFILVYNKNMVEFEGKNLVELNCKDGKVTVSKDVLTSLEFKIPKCIQDFIASKLRLFWLSEAIKFRLFLTGTHPVPDYFGNTEQVADFYNNYSELLEDGGFCPRYQDSFYRDYDLAMPVELEYFLKTKMDLQLLIFWLGLIKFRYTIDYLCWGLVEKFGIKFNYTYPNTSEIRMGRFYISQLIKKLNELKKEASGPSLSWANYYTEAFYFKIFEDRFLFFLNKISNRLSEKIFEALLPGQEYYKWRRKGKNFCGLIELSYWKTIWKDI